MNDYTAQFKRANNFRTRCGLQPYADVSAYLVAQGFTAVEAQRRAGSTATPNASSNELDDADVAEIYAKANRPHKAETFGTSESARLDNAGPNVDVTHGGRVAGINSPGEFTEQDGSRDIGQTLTAETRDWHAIAYDVYSGPINDQYRKTTGGAKAAPR